MKKTRLFFLIVLVLIIGVLSFALYFIYGAMPIGTGYTAKYLCSQVFLAGRDAGPVFEHDVKPTNALFSLITYQVDYENKQVTAMGFGFLRPRTAVFREGCGCTLAVDVSPQELAQQTVGIIPPPEPDPAGEIVDLENLPGAVDAGELAGFIDKAFEEPGPDTKRNTQAIVVVYQGRIIAEKYAEQFSQTTPILGWSMSKSVTNALVGILVRDGRLDIMQPAPVQAWQGPEDPRRKITLDQMLRMSSGLDFEEVYAPLKDVTYMLYDSRSMADYAAAKPLRSEPDSEWYYSSGTANIIARIVRDTIGGSLADVTNFARQELFNPLGMYSALIEPDASGSLVGSSYMFATARDWARFGVLIKNDGVWADRRILPEGWVKYSATPTPLAPQGQYGAHFWLNTGSKDNPADRTFVTLPPDLVYLSGFNGQIVAIIPSKDVVIVRLGATHDSSWSHEKFIRQVLECIQT